LRALHRHYVVQKRVVSLGRDDAGGFVLVVFAAGMVKDSCSIGDLYLVSLARKPAGEAARDPNDSLGHSLVTSLPRLLPSTDGPRLEFDKLNVQIRTALRTPESDICAWKQKLRFNTPVFSTDRIHGSSRKVSVVTAR